MTFTPVIMHRSNPVSWIFMPIVLNRVKDFCTRYGLDHDPEELAKLISHNFVVDDPNLFLIIGISGNKVVGHLLAGLDDFMNVRYLTIIQYEKDAGVDFFKNKKDLESAFDQVVNWGIMKGATQIQLLTPDEKRANYFERFYGFERKRILMRRPIEVNE